MSNAEEIRRLSNKRREINKKRQTADKRKRSVDKAKSRADELNASKFSTTFSDAVSSLKKGLKPLSATFDVSLPSDKSESGYLGDESYRLGRDIYKYQSEIDDLDYRIRNLQIEEG